MSLTSAIRAEWTKLRTAQETGWLLLAAVALTVAVGDTSYMKQVLFSSPSA